MSDKMSANEFQERFKRGDLISSPDKKGIISRKSRYDPDKSSNIAPPPGVKKNKKPKNPNDPRRDNFGKKNLVIPDLLQYSKAWFDKGGLYIPYNVISKKNSKRIMPLITIEGKPSYNLLPSLAYNHYMTATYEFYLNGKKAWKKAVEAHGIEGVIHVGLYFLRASKADSWDYQNMGHGPLDLMQSFEWIKKDDVAHIHTHYLGYEHDPKHPGVVIFLISPETVKPLLDIPKEGVKW